MAEITYLGQVMHWPLSTLLDLEHPDRRHFVDLVARQRAADDAPAEAW